MLTIKYTPVISLNILRRIYNLITNKAFIFEMLKYIDTFMLLNLPNAVRFDREIMSTRFLSKNLDCLRDGPLS